MPSRADTLAARQLLAGVPQIGDGIGYALSYQVAPFDRDAEELPPEIEAEADRQLAAALAVLDRRREAAKAAQAPPRPGPAAGPRVQLTRGRIANPPKGEA